MIDLHVHILPGVDDGSQDMEESLEMARIALESGVHTLAVTPHSNQEGRFENYMGSEFRERFRRLQESLRVAHLPLHTVPGMEIMASEDLGEKLQEGSLIGLNGTGNYLVEFPFGAGPEWIGERLEDVLDTGGTPLIAHPERYGCVQEYPALVYDWLKMGCRTQINKGSISGKFGRRAWQAADSLLRNDLITCVGSDAHSPYMRTTHMAGVAGYLEERFGRDYAYRLLEENPRIIIEGGTVPMHGRSPEKRRWFFR